MPASARGSTLLPALALFALGLGLGLWRLAEAPIIVDERVWMREGRRSFDLYRAGRFDDPFWSGYRASYGYPSAPFSKLLIGASLAAHGLEPGGGGVPGPELLRAGRLPSVLLGAAGAAALFGCARPFLGSPAAFVAGLLLLASPAWLMASRRAMVDVQSVGLWLAALWAFVWARDAARAGPARRLVPRFTGAGLLLGMAVGARFSGAGPAIGLGLLLGIDAGLAWRAGDRRRAGRVLLGAALLTAVALGVFVASYPYLHPDPIGGVRELVRVWEEVWTWRARRENPFWSHAYTPGLRSFRELADLFLLPRGWSLGLLAPAGLAALLVSGQRRRRLGAHRARVLLWAVALPALLAASFSPSRVMLSWIVWTGLVGAILCAALPDSGAPRDARARAAAWAFTAASLGAAALVLRQTYVPWPRYYLPLLPAVCALAAWGLTSLARSLERSAGRLPALCVPVALGFGVLAVLATGPAFATGMLGRGTIYPRNLEAQSALQLVAVVALAACVPLWLARRKPGP